jgi:hypothetical protein
MRFVVVAWLLISSLANAGVARAADAAPRRPDRDLSVTTGPGFTRSAHELTLNLDVGVLLRHRYLLAGAALQQGVLLTSVLTSGALAAGFGWRTLEPISGPNQGELKLQGPTMRFGVVGTLGVRRYHYAGNAWAEYDPGTSATLPFAGARASFWFVMRPRHRTHFLFGLSATVDANLGSTTRRYGYLDDGVPARGAVKLGGPRWGLSFDFGMLRDLR